MHMMYSAPATAAVFAILCVLFNAPTAVAQQRDPIEDQQATSFNLTALDHYVAVDDGCFHVTNLNRTVNGLGWTAHLYNVTSQCWQSPQFSTCYVWWHVFAVVVPDGVNRTSNLGMVYITGDSNDATFLPGASDPDLNLVADVAMATNNLCAVLYQVPNEPVAFPWDPFGEQPRTEDAAIAVTWWHYFRDPSNATVVYEFPMTKAGIKALDAIELTFPAFLAPGSNITRHMVFGASKRGWTTWLVGAVDAATPSPRVVAISPLVLDALNFNAFFARQSQFYGGFSFAVLPYVIANATRLLNTPLLESLQQLIDPYFYRGRLTMPKLAINAVGDEFQMPDDHRYWAHDMEGEMNLLMVKNAEHSLMTGAAYAIEGVSAFAKSLLTVTPRPNYTWSIDSSTGAVTLMTPVQPLYVELVYGFSADDGASVGRRDFRWAALGLSPCVNVFGGCLRTMMWTTENATSLGQDPATQQFVYRGIKATPSSGWIGFYIEAVWPNPATPQLPFRFTSPVSVMPNTALFPPCTATTVDAADPCFYTLV